ncbi:MAG: hypothetical protein KJ062_20665, partial [Thermoanaerobaculia bacterium]|nr:hypothetical protein [Thermoanaerobaculia bacterium]
MFETSLIESKKQQATGSRWLSVPMSIFLHFVIGGAVLAASMWYIEEIPEPPIPITFYTEAAPPPPPPPPPPKAAAPKATPKVEPVKADANMAPMIVPDVLPVAPSEPDDSSGMEG